MERLLLFCCPDLLSVCPILCNYRTTRSVPVCVDVRFFGIIGQVGQCRLSWMSDSVELSDIRFTISLPKCPILRTYRTTPTKNRAQPKKLPHHHMRQLFLFIHQHS